MKIKIECGKCGKELTRESDTELSDAPGYTAELWCETCGTRVEVTVTFE